MLHSEDNLTLELCYTQSGLLVHVQAGGGGGGGVTLQLCYIVRTA